MNCFRATIASFALLAGSITQSAAQDGPFHEGIGSALYHKSVEEALQAAGLGGYVNKGNSEEVDVFVRNREKIEALRLDSFAGGWIEYDSELKAYQVFAFSGKDNPLRHLKLEGRVEFAAVKFSFKELEALQAQIFEMFEGSVNTSNQLIFGIGIQQRFNKLLVSAREENHGFIISRLKDRGVRLDALELEKSGGPINLMGSIFGGSPIAISNDSTGNNYRCTAGFNVTIDAVYHGTITAAHCMHYNNAWNKAYLGENFAKGAYIGDFLADGWPDKMDAALFGNVNNVHTLHKKILTGPNTVASVKPPRATAENEEICRFGDTSGWHCGVVTAIQSEH